MNLSQEHKIRLAFFQKSTHDFSKILLSPKTECFNITLSHVIKNLKIRKVDIFGLQEFFKNRTGLSWKFRILEN